MRCPYCGSASFRTSRLRVSDIAHLLLFQYPVRCRACRERQFTGLILALNLRQAGRVRRLEERSKRSEENMRSAEETLRSAKESQRRDRE
jgi:hypothetical protein